MSTLVILLLSIVSCVYAEMSCQITCDNNQELSDSPFNDGATILQGPPGIPGLPGPKGERGDFGRRQRQVAFSAARNEPMGPLGRNAIIPYQHVFVNVGDSFDQTSGVFNCITPGIYSFMLNVQKRSDTYDTYIELIRNGNVVLSIHDNEGDFLDSASSSILLDLERGDKVWLQLGRGFVLYSSEGRYTTFSGFLVFPSPHYRFK
ncbi:cerebellin-3-like [Glandiceps talaboti]